MCLASETLSASWHLLRAPGSGAVFSEPLTSPCGVSAYPTPQASAGTPASLEPCPWLLCRENWEAWLCF